MMKKLLVTTLVGALVIAPVAFAAKGNMQDGMKRGGHPAMKMMKKLDLTDEQKVQVKDIMQQYKPQGGDKEQHQAMHEQRMAIITSATFDESAAQALIDIQQAKHQTRMLNMLQAQQEIYQVLTPEQQQKYIEMSSKKMEKQQKRMDKASKKAQSES
ncbi:Spy/CpxP family protein refolding chaperone [Agarivorans sp. Toyoura001]|uniref:Spy/CpxP family protein refolding chaperone n=1 Tax=Agarivorans sp. Toyoura001 TaxID=2283141 RepID=UPI0010F7DCB8|nr:Spy/CpxP family protein refolding chaperone [Agarivorans sp. Toyoura001]